MSDGASAAAGWYPDPYDPTRQRYWDGSNWTDHYHDGRSDGRLPDIGDWLSSTFSALAAYGIPAFGLAVGASVVLNLVTVLLLRWVAGDVQIVDEEVFGSVSGLLVRGLVVVLIVAALQGIVWLAVNRFMQRAHLQADPSIGEAVIHAARRLPRFVGVMLMLLIPFVLVLFAVMALIVATESAGLAILVMVLLIPASIFVWVKLAFLSSAVVAAPTSTSAIRASMSVSAGRFWGVLGRILLLAVGLAIVSGIIGAILGGAGSTIDQDQLADIFVAEGDTFVVTDFRLADLIPDAGDLLPFLLVSTVINAATSLVSTSGIMRLYLDSGAPSELS